MNTAQTVFAILSAAATVLATLAGLLSWVFRQGCNAGKEEARREAVLQAQADAAAKVISLEARLLELRRLSLTHCNQSVDVPDPRMVLSTTGMPPTRDLCAVRVPMVFPALFAVTLTRSQRRAVEWRPPTRARSCRGIARSFLRPQCRADKIPVHVPLGCHTRAD